MPDMESTDQRILDEFTGSVGFDQNETKKIADAYSPIDLLSKKFQMGVDGVSNAYHNVELMNRFDLSDDDELNLIQQGVRKVGTGFSKAAYESQNWFLQAVDDAAQVLPGIADTAKEGAVYGTGAFAAGLAARRFLPQHPFLQSTLAALQFGTGYTAGSVKSIWTQSAGELYGELRTAGVNRNTARVLAYTFGSMNAGLEFLGLNSLKGLAGNAFGQARSEAIRKALETPFVKQIENNMLGRLGLKYAENLAVEPTTEALQQISSELSKVIAGVLQKNQADAFTNWTDATANVKQSFLQALGASAVLGAAGGIGGYAIGKATGAAQGKAQEKINADVLNQLEGKSPQELLNAVKDGLEKLPDAWEGSLSKEEQNKSVAYDEQGNVYIKTGITKGLTTLQDRQKEALKKEPSDIPFSNRLEDFGNRIGQLKLVDVVNNPDAVIQEGLQAIYPQEEAVTPELPKDGEQLRLPLVEWRSLNADETQVRINQIASDSKVLKRESDRLESEIKIREETGQSAFKLIDKWRSVNYNLDALNSEREILEEGLGTTDIQGPRYGRLRIKKLSKLFDKIEDQADKIKTLQGKVKETGQQKLELGFRRGQYQTERSIRKIQQDLKNLVRTVTDDKEIQSKVDRYIAGVMTGEQAVKAAKAIREQALKFESQKVSRSLEEQRVKIFNTVQKMVNQNRVRLQSGHPSSQLPPELTQKLQVLRHFLKSEKNLNKWYSDFILKYGQKKVDELPSDIAEQLQLAQYAVNLYKGDALTVNVRAGEIAQWILDGKKQVQAKKDLLKKMKDIQLETARQSLGVNEKKPSNWIKLQKQQKQEFFADINSVWLTSNLFFDYLTPTDSNHTLTTLLDTTAQRAEFIASKNVAAHALADFIEQRLESQGFDFDIHQKISDDAKTKLVVRYKKADGSYESESFSKPQLLDVIMKYRDPSLHAALQNTETGNGWTFPGQVDSGESTIEVIQSYLKKEDIAFIDGLMDFYKEYYLHINDWYKRKYGVDLPMRDNYSPVSRVGYKIESPYTEEGLQLWSILPGSARTREESLLKIVPRNPFETVLNHISQWEYARTYDDKLNVINNVITDPSIRQHIRENFGEGTLKVFKDYFERFVKNDPIPDDSADSFWSAFRADISRFALGGKFASSFLTQLTSGTALWGNYSLPEIGTGIFDTIIRATETEQIFRTSPILRERFKQGTTLDLQRALRAQGLFGNTISKFAGYSPENLNVDTVNIWNRFLFAGITYGDATATRVFGGPVYWAERRAGKTQEEALLTVERLMEQTQQGSDVSQTPKLLTNPIVNSLVGMFTHQPLQLAGHSLIALRDFQNSKYGISDFYRLGHRLTAYWFIPGLLIGLVRQAPSLLLPPDEDEERDKAAGYEILGSALLGPAAGLPVFGDIIQALWFWAAKPLIGEDMTRRTDFYGKNPLIEAIYQNPKKAIQDWSRLQKMNESGELPDMTTDEYSNLETKAELSLARALLQFSGLPGQFGNAAVLVQDRLSEGDFIGASLALGGWGPGAINQRRVEEESLGGDLLGKEENSVYDILQEYYNSFTKNMQNSLNPQNTSDVAKEYEAGLVEGLNQ